jgi:hypothetical protein
VFPRRPTSRGWASQARVPDISVTQRHGRLHRVRRQHLALDVRRDVRRRAALGGSDGARRRPRSRGGRPQCSSTAHRHDRVARYRRERTAASGEVGWDGVTGCGTPVGQELLAKLGQSQQPVSDPVGTWDVNAMGFPASCRPDIDAQEPRRELHDLRPAHLRLLERLLRCSRSCGCLPERPEHLSGLHWLSDAAAAGAGSS